MDRQPTEANPLLGAPTDSIVSMRGADVGVTREAQRRRRLWRLTLAFTLPAVYLWWRILHGAPFNVLNVPHVNWLIVMPVLLFGVLIFAVVGMQWAAGRSPHVVLRPEQVDVRLADVKGIEPVKEEVVRSLNLFLSHKRFAADMGGTPRRGLLFEGAPGTGKTYLAKAMAREAGVPFLFVSATAFQSMWYGATARKIRAYFKVLRKIARQEGGAIGFIEEIDAIGAARSGLSATPAPPVVAGCSGMSPLPAHYAQPAGGISAALSWSVAPSTVRHAFMSEGTGGVVNELLIQMQSFNEPTGWQKLAGRLIDVLNLFLPVERNIKKPEVPPTNVLLIAATNRADNLDPALLRPGRFDRRLSFELPDKRGRRELVDHFLSRKSHGDELDDPEIRDALAGVTQGYTPVMIEHLFDEALVNAVRRGDNAMTWRDIERARLTEEVGLGQPVGYTDHEKRLIATHEAGHATAAYLVAPNRRLEVLSIIKRRQALGMLAHGDVDDVYTRSRNEMLALLQISLAGQCAEEMFFGDISTGPGGDLLYATNVAAEMVGSCGMAGTLLSFAAVQNSAFSDTNIVGRVLADPDGRSRVEELLQEQKAEIKSRLLDNRHLIEALRDALLDRDELIGREITAILDEAKAAGARPRVIDLVGGETVVEPA